MNQCSQSWLVYSTLMSLPSTPYCWQRCKIMSSIRSLWDGVIGKHSRYSIFSKLYVCIFQSILFIGSQAINSWQRLEFPLDPSLKRFHTAALIKLSCTSGLYPECMTLKGIKLVGNSALDGGGFGNIWKGLLGGQEICIKVLRIYQKSDKAKLLKVRLGVLWSFEQSFKWRLI
jgi:hypothetical protein